MTHVLAGLLVVTAMVSPYLVVAALAAAFPRLSDRTGQFPRTDQIVAQFFDRTALGVDHVHDDTREIRTRCEDDRSWTTAGTLGGRR
jgi:hypothetical protein